MATRREFSYYIFPSPAAAGPEAPLQPDEEVYVWQWGRAQRTRGRATVLSRCEVAGAGGATRRSEAPRRQETAQIRSQAQQDSPLCKCKKRHRMSSGWQPQVDRTTQERSTVRYADGTTSDVRNGRLTRVVPATTAAPMTIITPDTHTWRQLARSQLNSTEDALEIGCSTGAGTAIIAEHCHSVVAIDVGREVLERAMNVVPAAHFECFDVLRHPERLVSVAEGRSVVFADIGGNRELEALATLLPLVEGLPAVRLIVVKSKSLYNSALQWRDGQLSAQKRDIDQLDLEPEDMVRSEQGEATAARHCRVAQLHAAKFAMGTIGVAVPDGTAFISSLSRLAQDRANRRTRSRQARAERVASRKSSPERARAKALAQKIITNVLVGAAGSGVENNAAAALETSQRAELAAHLSARTGVRAGDCAEGIKLSLFAEWKGAASPLVHIPKCLFDPAFKLADSLICLNLSRNEMRQLHPAIGSLRVLVELDVSRNFLRRLPAELGQLNCLEKLDASSNHFRVAHDKTPLAALQLDSLAALPRLQMFDLRHVAKIGEYGKHHADLLSAKLGPGVCLITEHKTARERKQHAADRDATLLRSQIEPHATGTLRRRLALVFGDTTDPAKVEREEVIQRLLTHHEAAGGARQPLYVQGVPVCEKLCAQLKAQMDLWVEADIVRRRNPKEVRERTNIRAEHYMILSSPLAFSSTDSSNGTGGKEESVAARRAAAKLLAYKDMWDAAMRVLCTVDEAFAKRVTAVAFTKNFVGSPHIDTQNTGPFYGLSLGDFHKPGGALCVEQSAREVAYVDTRHRLAMVDGRFPHWVAPYEGNRYSAIFYQTRGDEVSRTTATFGTTPQVTNDPSTYPRPEDRYYNRYCKDTNTYDPPWY